MKRTFFSSCISLLLLGSCTDRQEGGASNVIDIEGALENAAAFTVSDFGKTVRYVPLETTDDCLIGGDPKFKVLRNCIVVESQSCLLFDKNDGHFIAEIGHAGQDPEAFSGPLSIADGREEFLYFRHMPDRLVKYDMKGDFRGSVTMASPPGLPNFSFITDSAIIGYYTELSNPGNTMLAVFDRDGAMRDTIPPFVPRKDFATNDITRLSFLFNEPVYGNLSVWGVFIIDYKDGRKQIMPVGNTPFREINGEIRFWEMFTDTIYTVTRGELLPSIAFNTGKWRWPADEKTDRDHSGNRILVTDVAENGAFVFFQCIRGLFTDGQVIYNGLYDKETGETRLAAASDAIRDDLTDFMPFRPLSIATSGEFVSFAEAADIVEWLEEHPEAKGNAKLAFLKDLDADMNPVVILVE
ncbi:MAG: DUF4934 domain-containing protein [Tannerella sp.]|jgi:hypothetical protein|nr:DUF4934 domain-containing protein [Tannerella sp.]